MVDIFDNQGKFQYVNDRDRATEQLIYEKAKDFQFSEPRETVKLFRLEEMRKLKNRQSLNDKDKMKECEK